MRVSIAMSGDATFVMTVPAGVTKSAQSINAWMTMRGSKDTTPRGHSGDPEPHRRCISSVRQAREQVRSEQEVQQIHRSEDDGEFSPNFERRWRGVVLPTKQPPSLQWRKTWVVCPSSATTQIGV